MRPDLLFQGTQKAVSCSLVFNVLHTMGKTWMAGSSIFFHPVKRILVPHLKIINIKVMDMLVTMIET